MGGSFGSFRHPEAHLAHFDTPRLIWLISALRGPESALRGSESSGRTLGGLGWSWVVLGGLGWSWVVLGGLGWSWVVRDMNPEMSPVKSQIEPRGSFGVPRLKLSPEAHLAFRDSN
jgi:hypothetical protein